MKTRDITDLMVCHAYHQMWHSQRDQFAYEFLARQTGAPEKVCYRACERAHKHGLIEYGTSLRSGWLTAKGRDLLESFIKSQGPLAHKAWRASRTHFGYPLDPPIQS